MHVEDFDTSINIWTRHDNLTVEATGTQQCRIKDVRAVGGGDDDDAFISFKTVHFDQQLVQRLFALVILIAKAGTTAAAHRVDFIDEDDARRVFLCLLKHVAYAACTNTYKHFDKIRTGDREEWHASLASNCACEQSLAGPRRTNKQSALGDFTTKAAELLRVFQKFDDFLKLFTSLVNAGDIIKGYLAMLFSQQLCFRLTEAHGSACAATFLHLP